MKASLYIHVPFCARKCAYCDFESYAGRLHRADEYIDRVLEEARGLTLDGVPTAYIGGGTPSLLEPDKLARLMGGVFDMLTPDPGAEITMEANPGTVTYEKLRAAKNAGVNRISFGVQALQDRLLEMLGRIHSFDEAVTSVKMAQDAGFSNISCDVMYALPGQTENDLTEPVARLAGLGITHISCYSLILEEGTRLFGQVERGELTPPGEDAECAMQDALLKTLKSLGFERYEISNYSKPGYESRHNTVYWTGGNYAGLGCAAHSFMEGERYCNPGFDEYMAGATHTESEYVSDMERLEEKLLLTTRMTRGVSLSEFGSVYAARLIKEASKPRYRGLVSTEGGYLRFTDAGLMVHNALVPEFVTALYD